MLLLFPGKERETEIRAASSSLLSLSLHPQHLCPSLLCSASSPPSFSFARDRDEKIASLCFPFNRNLFSLWISNISFCLPSSSLFVSFSLVSSSCCLLHWEEDTDWRQTWLLQLRVKLLLKREGLILLLLSTLKIVTLKLTTTRISSHKKMQLIINNKVLSTKRSKLLDAVQFKGRGWKDWQLSWQPVSKVRQLPVHSRMFAIMTIKHPQHQP